LENVWPCQLEVTKTSQKNKKTQRKKFYSKK
jgi:hypothetical protein